MDGDPVSVGSWSQHSFPEIQPFFLPWMLWGLQLSIPRVLIRVSQASVQAGREASAAQGMPRLGPCMLWGFPAFLTGAAELGGAEPAAPHKPGGSDQLLDRCWGSALERRLGKGEGGSCPESEEESSAPLGLNFSTLFRRSLQTRILVSRASRPDSRADAALEPTRSQKLSLTGILWSSSQRNNTGRQEVFPTLGTLVSGSGPPLRGARPAVQMCVIGAARGLFSFD